jgi:hypothetical protein
MIATADTARVEQLLEPLELGAIPDFGDTHPDEIFEGFNEDLDVLLRERSGQVSGGREYFRQFGHIGVTAFARQHEGGGNLSDRFYERKLRLTIPWVVEEADTAPAEITQFKTTHQSPMYGSTSIRGRAMQLSSGVVIPHKPLLEAVGVDTAQSPIDTEELLERSVLYMRPRTRTIGEPDTPYFIDENTALRRAYGVASAVLGRLSGTV